MKYRVEINDDTFYVTVEPIDDGIILKSSEEIGADIAFEASKNEYEHSIQRSVKLDNKVYIMLTVSAFLFVALSTEIERIKEICFPQTKAAFVCTSSYITLLIINIAVFVVLLINLITLLKGVKLYRLESFDILENDLISAPKKQTIRYICMRYEQCRSNNNALIESQYKKFNLCVTLMVAIVVMLILEALLGSLL